MFNYIWNTLKCKCHINSLITQEIFGKEHEKLCLEYNNFGISMHICNKLLVTLIMLGVYFKIL